MMKVNMLGPAEFRYGDSPVGFRPLEKRVHLALYLGGGTRSMRELAEDVWGVSTPSSLVTLRGCVSRPRRKVVAAGGKAEDLSRTVRAGDGNTRVCLPDTWDVDADHFQHGAEAARLAYDKNDFTQARALIAATEPLWKGDPLPDAGVLPFAVHRKRQLLDAHWSLTLTRIKTRICLGGHREVISELGKLWNDRPDEGDIPMLLATALYRSDRIADAMKVCEREIAARRGIGGEAHRLRRLQESIIGEVAPARGHLGWLTAR
jgi:DNA-binding SARP family transcriptional activator